MQKSTCKGKAKAMVDAIEVEGLTKYYSNFLAVDPLQKYRTTFSVFNLESLNKWLERKQ